MWLTPAASVSRGPACVTSRPATVIVPGVGLAQPHDRLDQLALAVRVDAGEADDLARAHRPATRRARPAARGRRARETPSTSSSGSPGLCSGFSTRSSTSRPTISRASERSVAPSVGHRVDLLAAPQDRHAVGDVQHLVELVRDEDDRRALARSACAGPRTGPAPPAAVSTAVGSSSTSTFAPRNSARRISTRCWAPTPRSSTRASGSTARPNRCESSRTPRGGAPCSRAAGRCAARRRAPGSRRRSSPARA